MMSVGLLEGETMVGEGEGGGRVMLFHVGNSSVRNTTVLEITIPCSVRNSSVGNTPVPCGAGNSNISGCSMQYIVCSAGNTPVPCSCHAVGNVPGVGNIPDLHAVLMWTLG